MDRNSITNDYSKYFMDYHHVYPEYTHLIVDKLQDINATSSNKDFGIILNKENINEYIKNLDWYLIYFSVRNHGNLISFTTRINEIIYRTKKDIKVA